MNFNALIRFAFASKRRKLATLCMLGTAGISSLLGVGADKAEPKQTTPTTQPSGTPTTQSQDVTYANCQAVKDAGKAPIRRGDPGYGSHLDRNGDGVACE